MIMMMIMMMIMRSRVRMMRMIMGGTGQEPGWFLLKIRGGLGELGECGAGGLLLCSFTFFCAHRGGWLFGAEQWWVKKCRLAIYMHISCEGGGICSPYCWYGGRLILIFFFRIAFSEK